MVESNPRLAIKELHFNGRYFASRHLDSLRPSFCPSRRISSIWQTSSFSGKSSLLQPHIGNAICTRLCRVLYDAVVMTATYPVPSKKV
jgi:hypothetical protein